MNSPYISDKISENKPVISVEFFPAKTEEGARQILRTAHQLTEYNPDFVSITYGAGGSTRERTLAYAELIKDIFSFEVMPHLTCVGHSRDELRDTLQGFKNAGFHNIMTLRGDPPKGETEFKPHPDGLSYASELVSFIKETFPEFCLGVAGYPEAHPEAPDLDTDLKHLKTKVDNGADFVTTQLFFDNQLYFDFVDKARALGIHCPIIPGLLPAVSTKQLVRFCDMCGSTIPQALMQKLEAAGDDDEAVRKIGVEWVDGQIKELLERGAPGFHLYILNRSASALELFDRLRKEKLIG